ILNCTVIKASNINNFISNSSLSALFLNIRSLQKNFDEFNTFVNMYRIKPMFIGLSEIWLKPNTPPTLFQLDGYVFVTEARDTKVLTKCNYGGVGIYVREDLLCTIRHDLNFIFKDVKLCEILFLEIDSSTLQKLGIP